MAFVSQVKQAMDYLELATKIVQIAFWAIASAVAVLTYRHARRTVLQPIRTEIFKAQLQAMSQIMGLFLGKDELALRREFDFDALFHVNLWRLIDAYAMNFFDVQIDPESRPYNWKDCPMRMGVRDSDNRPSTSHLRQPNQDAPHPKSDPRVRSATWSRYQTEFIYINRKYCEAERNLNTFLENPLLPQRLVGLLTEYRWTAAQNQLLLHEILDAAAPELPEKYTTLEQLERISPDWLWNRYMHDFKNLKPVAAEIVTFIRDYFDPDNLAKSQELTDPSLNRTSGGVPPSPAGQLKR
jgi:hypothetical protein